MRWVYTISIPFLFIAACTNPTRQDASRQACVDAASTAPRQIQANEQAEVDTAMSLFAYAIVHSEWQDKAAKDAGTDRGYNIGSVLVSPAHIPILTALNSNDIENDGTQHGEVRAMRAFFAKCNQKYAAGYTVYTTLEPCAMCSGLLTMAKLNRVVYGQLDPEYGGAHARLNELVPETARPPNAGTEWAGPYPRLFKMDAAPSSVRSELEQIYAKAHELEPNSALGTWLYDESAEAVFARGHAEFCHLQLQTPTGQRAYSAARTLAPNLCD